MTAFTRLALASTLALGFALPALAQTAPDTTTTPAATAPDQTTTPDSGIKPASPETAPVKKSAAKHHHTHVKHAAKTVTPAAAKS